MFERLFRKSPKEDPTPLPTPPPQASALVGRTLAKAMEARDGSEISIPEVRALSAALQNYFHDKRQPLIASFIDLLSFSTPEELTKIGADIGSLGSRGVAIESASSTFFRFGSPAISRYLKSFRIELDGDQATEFLLNVGRTVRFTLSQLPSHLSEVVRPSQMPSAYPALKAFCIFAAKSHPILSPSTTSQALQSATSPTKTPEFQLQLAYELDTLISRPAASDGRPHWRVEEAELRGFARTYGVATLVDPFACLQKIHNEVRSTGLLPELIFPGSYEERIEIAHRAVGLVVSKRDAILTETLKIASGYRKDG